MTTGIPTNINIEAQASIAMVKNQFIPVTIAYTSELAKSVSRVKEAGSSNKVQKALLDKITGLLESASKKLDKLEAITKKAQGEKEAKAKAEIYRDDVVPAMNDLRGDIDTIETLVPSNVWPVPSYAEMLFKL